MATKYDWLFSERSHGRKRGHVLALFILALSWICISGCAKGADKVSAPATASVKSSAPAGYATSPYGKIVSISPEVLEVHSGHAVPTRYTLAYTIANPESVREASIFINSPSPMGFGHPSPGVIMKTDVPVVASGTLDFVLDVFATVDFGQAVRFRLHCPSGDTDWYTMGTADAYDPKSAAPQIRGVFPMYDEDDMMHFDIYPNYAITSECTVEAQVDRTPVNLIDSYAGRKSMTVGLNNITRRPIAARYLEFTLYLKGKGGEFPNTKRIRFSE